MIDESTAFFSYKNNFEETSSIESELIVNTCHASGAYITIAIPTYKRAALLEEAVDSALFQNNSCNYEIIIVDNNPERGDETEKLVLRKYCQVPNIRYYKNKSNLGMFGNINRLFSLSRTHWLVMLHDDDVLFPDYLFYVKRILDHNKILELLVVGRMVWFQNKGEQMPKPKVNNKKEKLYRLKLGYVFNNQSSSAPSGYVFNKDAVLELGGYDAEMYPSSDYVFYSKLLSREKVYYYTKQLMVYRYLNNATFNIDVQKKSLIEDYYLRKYIGNFLRYPEKYIQFIIKKKSYSRLLLLQQVDPNFDSSIPELNKKVQPSNLKKKLYRLFDIIERWYWNIKLKSESV